MLFVFSIVYCCCCTWYVLRLPLFVFLGIFPHRLRVLYKRSSCESANFSTHQLFSNRATRRQNHARKKNGIHRAEGRWGTSGRCSYCVAPDRTSIDLHQTLKETEIRGQHAGIPALIMDGWDQAKTKSPHPAGATSQILIADNVCFLCPEPACAQKKVPSTW